MTLKDVINNLDEKGFSLLHLNAKDGNAETVQNLIEDGANIEIKDKKNGSTPLLWACQSGHTNVVKILLQNNANVFATSFCKKTSLHFASQSGNAEIVQILIDKGAHVDIKEKGNGQTPLLLACENGHINVVKALLQNNANVNEKSRDGSTVLHLAAQNGQIDLLEILMKIGMEEMLRQQPI